MMDGAAKTELCRAKTELLVAYQKTASIYSKAVAELCHYAGAIPQVEYERLCLLTERARKVCEAARDALGAHVSEHHC
jgi:hypothetical protein